MGNRQGTPSRPDGRRSPAADWARLRLGNLRMFDALLGRVSGGEDLSQAEAAECIAAIMRGEVDDGRIGVLLTALHEKGETADEVAGAAAALRGCMTPIGTDRTDHLDTCGTGGDGSGTFNISTAAALVAAAAGAPVAKHGNRSITSRTGSADALAALGVNIEADVATVERCLSTLGICFCFAPLHHPAMRRVSQVRKQLGFPTIFNLLGPLSNPAAAPYQLLGVGKPALRPLLAGALARLDIRRALVVSGADGLDEFTLAAPTHVSIVAGDRVEEATWTPEDFGLARVPDLTALQVDGPPQSAAMIQSVLRGDAGPARDIVVLNAAAGLIAAQRETNPQSAAAAAADALDSGAAHKLLERLAAVSHGEA